MRLLDGKDVMVGVIDVACDVIETPEQVAETIGRALQFVPRDRLFACTNCGLAPMGREVAEAKLEALAQGRGAGARERHGDERRRSRAPIDAARRRRRGARAGAATRCSTPAGFARFAGARAGRARRAAAVVGRRCRPTRYLRDGGRYRRRRHSCFVVDGDDVAQVPHRAHWQPVEYNALHGGIERWFEPIEAGVVASAGVARACSALAPRSRRALRGAQPWYVEAHQFRIDTTDGIGRPTPEGAHRDGVDLVAVSWSAAKASRAARRACSTPTARPACASR